MCADGDGLRVLGEQAHQRCGEQQAQHGSGGHDARAQRQRYPEDTVYPLPLACAVVIADDRPHALNDAACGHIQERLQLIVDTQHDHIRLTARQQRIQAGNQQGRQRKVERRRNADRIQPSGQTGHTGQTVFPQAHRRRTDAVQHQIARQRHRLSDAGGQRRAAHPHLRERADAEDEQRIEHDIRHAAGHHRQHGDFHAAHRLIDLLERQLRHQRRREQERHIGIFYAERHHVLRIREQPQKPRHDGDAHCRTHDAVQHRTHHAAHSRRIGLVTLTRAEVVRNDRVDTHTEADSQRVYQILHREHQRQRRDGILAQLCHEQAVDDVVQRVDQHRQHHRQRHRQQQRQHGLFPHKSFVQVSFLPFCNRKPHDRKTSRAAKKNIL